MNKFFVVSDDTSMLDDYTRGLISSNDYDPLPSISVSLNVHEYSDVFFKFEGLLFLGPNLASGRAVYKLCVISLKEEFLNKRVDTPWRAVLLNIKNINKRILHGSVASHSFTCVLKPDVCHEYQFCALRETVFHGFMQCVRLEAFIF